MNIAEISQLTHASLNKLTSEAYKDAFSDPQTGDAFRARINELENSPRPAASRPAGNVRADAPTPTPAMTSFDPSFDSDPNDGPSSAAAAVPPARGVRGRVEQPAAAQPAAAPIDAAAQPAAPATVDESLPELVHEYQPVDRSGRPVGHKQSFKYRTQAELIEKLTAAHSAASAHIRELTRNKRLEEIVAVGPTEKNFTPSTEVPKTMEELAKELLEQRQQNFLLSVREALNAFQLSADWAKYRSAANAESVVLAVERLGLSPAEPLSYHTAFQHMKAVLEPVVVAAEPAPAPTPAPVAAVAATPAPAVRRTAQPVGVSTGISNVDSFNEEPDFAPAKVPGVRLVLSDGKSQVMTLQAWEKLPSEKQRRILLNAANANAIESLFVAANEQRMAARR